MGFGKLKAGFDDNSNGIYNISGFNAFIRNLIFKEDKYFHSPEASIEV